MAGKSLYSQKGEGVRFVYKLVSLMQIPSKILECMICKQYMIRILNTGDESGFTKTKLCQPHLISFYNPLHTDVDGLVIPILQFSD